MNTLETQISQIVQLSTGQLLNSNQLAGWEAYVQSGGSLQSVTAAFVASTAFANQYNNGTAVNPNSAVTPAITQAITDHTLGSHTSAQVDAWVNTGLSVAQVLPAVTTVRLSTRA